ncbi:MAG: HD domain-containing protein [Peptococcaceae bacterium]|nr:HD domain-containing protein [Peptococcaceae bacterium]
MRLGQDIYNKNKILLLSNGAILTDENIKIIKRLGYASVNVDKTEESPGSSDTDFWLQISPEAIIEIKELYAKTNTESDGLIKTVISGKPVTTDEAYGVPGSILSTPSASYDLLPSLAHVMQLDNSNYNHSINVSLVCGIICRWLGLDEEVSKEYVVAGLFHDIGKTQLLPDIVYNNNRSFLEEEEYRGHTRLGYNILKRSGASEDACLGALLHHERLDGSGYPGGLKEDKIPLVAKIIAVADTFDKLTTDMSKSGSNCPFKVLKILKEDNLGFLDTKLLMLFCTRTAECYVGEMVILTDGSKGQIVMANKNNPCKPIVNINGKLIDLEHFTDLEILSLATIND